MALLVLEGMGLDQCMIILTSTMGTSKSITAFDPHTIAVTACPCPGDDTEAQLRG